MVRVICELDNFLHKINEEESDTEMKIHIQYIGFSSEQRNGKNRILELQGYIQPPNNLDSLYRVHVDDCLAFVT